MQSPESNLRNHEQLIGDLRTVIENAEELLKNTDQYTSAMYQQARDRLAQALQAATVELGRFEDNQLDRMMAATQAANDRHADQSGEAKLLRAFD